MTTEPKDPEVVIFGAGQVGQVAARILQRAGIKVAAFLDNHKPEGFLCAGIQTYRPGAAPKEISRSLPVVIGVWRADAEPSAILAQLGSLGWTRVSTMAGFIRERRKDLGDFYWGTPPGYYERPEVISAIERARGIWADDLSLRTFDHLVRLRRDFDDDTDIAPNPDEYLPGDVPGLLAEPLRFVDIGAYDGAVLGQLVDKGLKVEAAALFEPTLKSFSRMADLVRERRYPFPALLWPCALGEMEASAGFHQDEEIGMSSSLAAAGESKVTVLRLDAALQGFSPNYMKLDVEGFELSVLKGAASVISESAPNLAVCLYHKAEDLWEIPLWLVDTFPGAGYRHYLRRHAYGLDSHCLYAVNGAR